jgi:hypothetical protein
MQIIKKPGAFFLLIILIGFFENLQLKAQNGPGGIGDTTGNSSLLLWLDASQIEGKADLNTITRWEDHSGYGNHAATSFVSGKPYFREEILNGAPVVGFNGTSNYLQGDLGAGFGSPSTLIAVPYFNDLTQATGENGYIISVGTSGSSHNHFSIGRRNSSGGDGNKYYSWVNDGSPKLGGLISGQEWHILTQLNASAAPYHQLYIDGSSSSVIDYSSALSTDGVYRIGQWYHGGNNNLDGRLAEIIAYNKVLSTTELSIVHSYLGAKYDLNVVGDLYNGDDSVNGDNDLSVVGIGVEGADSNAIASSAGIWVEIEDHFDDGDYLLLGHNVIENKVNTTDVNGNIKERWERAWWFDISNTGQDLEVNITFSLVDGEVGYGGLSNAKRDDYKLIYKSSPSDSWTELATASSIAGNYIYFKEIALVLDGYYCLASVDTDSKVGNSPVNSGSKGPGGVGETDGSSTLELWLNAGDMDAADGDYVLRITDESGNGNDVVQTNSLNIPAFKSGIVNNHAAVAFNGSNSYMEGSVSGSITAPLTVFSVAYFNNINQVNDDNDYVYSIGSGLSRGDQISISRRKANDEDDVANINKYYCWDGDTARFGSTVTGQTWNIFTQEFKPSGSPRLHDALINGSDLHATDNEVEVNTNTNTLSVGRWNGNDHWLDGYFSELIIYDRLLNTAEINIIQAYLSGKYDIAVSGDYYDGDESLNGDFDLDIAGIGTESDGSNIEGNSAGLILTQSNGFDVGDYLIVGHAEKTNSIDTSDASDNTGLNVARWKRIWYFDVRNSGDPLIVDLSFDFSDVDADGFPGSQSRTQQQSLQNQDRHFKAEKLTKAGSNINYTLLYRTSNSGVWTNLGEVATINGDQVVFNDVEINSNGYYTLGTTDPDASPLPVTLLSFMGYGSGVGVDLYWETLSELNNREFIVLKSRSGKDFTEIGRVKGAGNSWERRKYSFHDADSGSGTLYYVLRQIDFDGKEEEYGPVAVQKIASHSTLALYPNPCKETLFLEGLYGKATIRFISPGGKLVKSLTGEYEKVARIDLKDLREGIYFLKIEQKNSVQIIPLIKQ